MKKKYQVAILIELFTIFIMISWSVMIFRMKHEIKASQTAEHMNEVISWYHSYELNAKGNSKGDLLEYLLSQKFPSYYVNHGMTFSFMIYQPKNRSGCADSRSDLFFRTISYCRN